MAETKKAGRPTSTQKIKELEAALAQQEENASAQLEELKQQVALLTNALALGRQNPVMQEQKEDLVAVQRVGGGAIHVPLTDAHGKVREFVWETEGEVQNLTKAQYEELLEGPANSFIERGFLAVEGDYEKAIKDAAKFIESLALDEVEETVQAMEDSARLLRIINHIENSRIVTEDEDGKPLTDSDGNVRAEMRKLSAKYRIVAEAVVNRLRELTGVQYSLTDSN